MQPTLSCPGIAQAVFYFAGHLANKVNAADAYTKTQIDSQMANKVQKEAGKGLSANDYTDAEKTKLNGIATGATKTTVNNTLTSTSTTDALSAAQGKALNDSKAPLASPALTGVPTAPTAAQSINNTQLATTAYVQAGLTAKPSETELTITASGIVTGGSGENVYSKDANGRVTVEVSLKSSGGADSISGNNITIATLPSGYRPKVGKVRPLFARNAGSSQAPMCGIYIGPTGAVTISTYGVSVAFLNGEVSFISA